ncbi:hypothetical protein GCM10009540_66080 [Streptomyces turgidiscabies]
MAALFREPLEHEHRQDPVGRRPGDAEPVGDVHDAQLTVLVQESDGTQGVACGAHWIRGGWTRQTRKILHRGIVSARYSSQGNA